MLYTAMFVLGAGYLVLLALIAVRAARKARGGSPDEQWIGDRNFGGVATGFTFGASQLSASGVIGAAGLGYDIGATFTILIVLALVVTYAIVFFVIGPRIRRATGRLQSRTIPEFLGQHFSSKSIRVAAAILVIVLLVPVLIVQFRASGLLVNTVFDIPYGYGILITGALVAAYSAFGGYQAVVDTDIMQGLVMIFGLLLLGGAVLYDFGGLSNLVNSYDAAAPGLLDLGGVLTPLAAIGIFLSFAVALFGQPYIVTRFITISDRKSAYSGAFVIAMVLQLISISAVLAAMAGRVRYPELEAADSVIFQVAIDFLSPWFAALLLLAMLSALMSTVDSGLLVVGSSIVKDLMIGSDENKFSRRVESMISKWGTLLVGAGCAVLALRPPELITMLMAQVSGVIGIIFGIPLVLALVIKKFSATGVWASWLAGGTGYLAMMALDQPVPAVMVGLGAGLAAAGLTLLIAKPRQSGEVVVDSQSNSVSLNSQLPK